LKNTKKKIIKVEKREEGVQSDQMMMLENDVVVAVLSVHITKREKKPEPIHLFFFYIVGFLSSSSYS
jgi:hypothetical protein